jgi:hypothetical protein
VNQENNSFVDQEELKKEEIVKLINELSVDLKENVEVKINKELKSLANEEESTNNIFKGISEILTKVSQKLT